MAVENQGASEPIAINSEVLAKVISRIVEVAQPDKIIMFGRENVNIKDATNLGALTPFVPWLGVAMG